MKFLLLACLIVLSLVAIQAQAETRTLVNEQLLQPIPEPNQATWAAPRARYLALGDSYTIGEAVNPSERFPAQLVQQLRARASNVEDATILARTGWTTDELWNAIDTFEQQRLNEPEGQYELVTLLIGVNNQYRGRTVEDYRLEFEKMLQRAIGYAGNRPARVIVISIPDWGVTPFGKNRKNVGPEIDAYNAMNRAETSRVGARYVDITPLSREALHDTTLLAPDGLHPSGKMYSQWVDLILPIAEEILGQAS